MGAFYEFEQVDMFTVGALGRPGERLFVLQVRADGQRVTIKCEKQQAAAISEYLRRLLADLPAASDRPIAGAMELTTPIEPLFALGPIGLGYDRDHDRILIQLEEAVALTEDGEPDPDELADRGHVRVYVHRSQAAAFCAHADEVVAAGRPACFWCTRPLDPDGHVCVRMN